MNIGSSGDTIKNWQYPKRKVKAKLTNPQSGNALKKWQPRGRKYVVCFDEYCVKRIYHENCACPQGGNTKRKQHFRFAEVQADVCSTARGTAQEHVGFYTWIFSINSVLHSGFKAYSRSLTVLQIFNSNQHGTLIHKTIMIFNVIRVPFIELRRVTRSHRHKRIFTFASKR